MKKIFFLLFLFAGLLSDAQPYLYKKDTAMIRMRDGVRLFTVIYSPIGLQGKFPFMIERTPYGALNTVVIRLIFHLILVMQRWQKMDTYLFSRTSAASLKARVQWK